VLLVVRRIPPLVLLYKWIPDVHSLKEALFCAHFGPMGVGAVFISTLALTKLPEPRNPPETQLDLLALCIQPIVAFIILCSILIHGLSVPLFMMGKRVRSVSKSWSVTVTRDKPEWLNMTRAGRPSSATVSISSQFAQADIVERGPSVRRRGTPMPSYPGSGANTPPVEPVYPNGMPATGELPTRPAEGKVVAFVLDGEEDRPSVIEPIPTAGILVHEGKSARGDSTPASARPSTTGSQDMPATETSPAPAPKEVVVEVHQRSTSPLYMEITSHPKILESPTAESP